MDNTYSTDAIAQLKKDHENLKGIMAELEKAAYSHDERLSELFKRFRDTFNLHDRLEDEVLYPEMQKHSELKDFALKGWQAHHIVEVGILELRLLPFSSDWWAPKFAVIQQSILTHMDEEENQFFPQVEKIMSQEVLSRLNKEMNDLRERAESS